jgi:dihydrofolate reductase
MIAALFAVDEVGGMGNKGSLSWPNNKDDMMWFKTTTQGQIVVMGRRTWDSPDMPKPLPGRFNVIFTNDFFEADDVEQVKGDVCEALKALKHHHKKKNIFVIGGPNLLLQSKPVLERVYITRIKGEFINDTFINVNDFLEGMTLKDTINLGSCIVEEYHNETIQPSVRTHTSKRKTED